MPQTAEQYILSDGATGILRRENPGNPAGRVLFAVIVNGHQTGLWTKRRWARNDLRRQKRARRRTRR
jgi:hypothetical protein